MSAGLLAGPTAAHMAAAAELAQNAAPAPAPATAAPAPQAAAPSAHSHARGNRADVVEARITALHDELKITPAQSAQWNDVAQVMRENAHSMETLVRQRSRNAQAMTAIDDLRSYEEIAEAHADGVKRLLPAFQALYDTMSPEQKKTADAAFRHHGGRNTARKAAAKNHAG
ncbi:MAG TPA: Spy/CpxP family protein refolding chaperone [Stellaceae bacterium]